jgi:hypothetical protein
MRAPKKLLDATETAKTLGVSTWVIKGLKIASAASGDSPFTGRYTRVSLVLAWLDRHPDFVASHYIRHRKEAQKRVRAA